MDTILATVSQWPLVNIYLLAMLFIYLENVIPFVPGDAILVVTAILSTRHIINPTAGYFFSVLCGISGFVCVYLFGKHWGRDFFMARSHFLISRQKIEKGDRLFHEHAYKTLVLGRFIPGMRFIVAIIAGFTHFNILRATIASLLSIMVWNIGIFLLVDVIGDNWSSVRYYISEYNHFMLALTVLAVIIFLIVKYFRKRENNL